MNWSYGWNRPSSAEWFVMMSYCLLLGRRTTAVVRMSKAVGEDYVCSTCGIDSFQHGTQTSPLMAKLPPISTNNNTSSHRIHRSSPVDASLGDLIYFRTISGILRLRIAGPLLCSIALWVCAYLRSLWQIKMITIEFYNQFGLSRLTDHS